MAGIARLLSAVSGIAKHCVGEAAIRPVGEGAVAVLARGHLSEPTFASEESLRDSAMPC
jgi:hypothetical protein